MEPNRRLPAAASLFAAVLCTITASAALAQAHEHGSPMPAASPAPTAASPSVAASGASASDSFFYPDPDPGVAALPQRRQDQLAHAGEIGAFHGFGFTDRLSLSGITFRHEAVDDSGRTYKMVHYDHGNGLAVADVDGDGMLDIYFVTQLGSNQLWHNNGDGHFSDVTGRAGIGLIDQISVTASFADYDNDGDPDLFVTTVRKGNHLFRNEGKNRFTEVTKEAGVDYSGHSSGAVFFDYDKDGKLDLFVTNVGRYTTDVQGRGGFFVGMEDAFQGHLHPERSEPSILYHNLGGGKFEDVSKTVLEHVGWSGDATAIDANADGWPDLYVLSMQGDDRFYRNDGGKRFVEETAPHFAKTPWGAMGVKALDYDDDGRVDLMLTDMHSDMSMEVGVADEKKKANMQWTEQMLQGGENNVFGNALFHNLGEGRFEEVSDAMGVENYWPWGLSAGDLNADGYQDLFITASMSFPFRYAINSLLLNDGGKVFRDAEFILGVEPRRGNRTHTAFTVWECDGADRDKTPCQGRSGKVRGMTTLGSRASVLFDLDGDGDLDIVTSDFNAEPQVLVSDLAQKKADLSWLKVRLHGAQSNRDGLGAKVVVKAGGKTLTQWYDGKSGYLSQSSMPLYFGLDGAKTIDSVEVTWPSGIVQTVKARPNTTVEVGEKGKR
ncbi:MAG TPA: CRTAC1 family protein [Thermoanaerobaculia bacterium]|jgi:hypothetical protein|nr:CRTAC1 family protein [Thermoanaerobaculia bacterium]